MQTVQYKVRNWHVVTWGVFCLWLAFGLWAQIVPRIAGERIPNPSYQMAASSGAAPVYTAETKIGWPLTIQTWSFVSPGNPLTTTTSWFGLAANAALMAAVQCSIVVVCQTFSQFSLGQLMGLALLVAVMMTIGRLLATIVPDWDRHYLVPAIYFSPLFFWLVIFSHSTLETSR